MKTKVIAVTLAFLMLFAVLPAAVFYRVSGESLRGTAEPGQYKVTLSPRQYTGSEYYSLFLSVLDDSSEYLFHENLAGSDDSWDRKTAEFTAETAPVVIRFECSYKLRGWDTAKQLVYEAPFEECYEELIASDSEPDVYFCRCTVERTDGGVLRYMDGNGQPQVRREGEYEQFTGLLGSLDGSDYGKEKWFALRGDPSPGHIDVKCDAHLVLCDDSELECSGGITIWNGASLTIYGQKYYTGKLEARGDFHHSWAPDVVTQSGTPGIGGPGSLTVNGGHITAYGGYNAAGIGGSENIDDCGQITINGGADGSGTYVFAQGGTIRNGEFIDENHTYYPPSNGAGIGGGYKKPSATITINGGTVHAVGANGAAGIGGGCYAGSGPITITGGVVTAETISARSQNYGAGIGGGHQGSSDSITITGGTITAIASSPPKGDSRRNRNIAAGIGSGGYGEQSGKITISGGDVTAICYGMGAGIGSSMNAGDIEINGKDTAVAAFSIFGAGIGGGGKRPDMTETERDSLYGGNITINDGCVLGVSSYGGAGIGAGIDGTGGRITINDGYVIGYGGADHFSWLEEHGTVSPGNSKVHKLDMGKVHELFNDTAENIIADLIMELIFSSDYSGAGIGGGSMGDGGTVMINGGTVIARAGDSRSCAIGWGMDGTQRVNLSIYERSIETYGKHLGNEEVEIYGETAGSDKEQKAKTNSYVKIEPADILVTFNTLGICADPPSQLVAPGAYAQTPDDPEAEGYIFDGWFTDPDLDEEYDFMTPVTEPLDLYAKWIRSISLSVKKAWSDGEERPDQVKVKIERRIPTYYYHIHSYSPVIDNEITIKEQNGWKETVEITDADILTFEEESVDGFMPESWSIAYDGGRIELPFDNNTHTAKLDLHSQEASGLSAEDYRKVLEALRGDHPELTVTNVKSKTYSVEKRWSMPQSGYTPDELTVALLHRENEAWKIVQTVKLNSGNEWKADFYPVPEDDASLYEDYRVRELDRYGMIVPASGDNDGESVAELHISRDGSYGFNIDFTAEYTEGPDGKTVVTNSAGYMYSVKMEWESFDDKIEKPDEVKVELYHNEAPYSEHHDNEIVLNEENGWQGVFEPQTYGSEFVVYEYGYSLEYPDSYNYTTGFNEAVPLGNSDKIVFSVGEEGHKRYYQYDVSVDYYNDTRTFTVRNKKSGLVYPLLKKWETPENGHDFAGDIYAVDAYVQRRVTDGQGNTSWENIPQDEYVGISLSKTSTWRNLAKIIPITDPGFSEENYRVREYIENKSFDNYNNTETSAGGTSGGRLMLVPGDEDYNAEEPPVFLVRHRNDTSDDNPVQANFNVSYGFDEHGEYIITNRQAGVFSAEKNWVDKDGETLTENIPESVSMVLQHKKGDGIWEPVEGSRIELNSGNSWKGVFPTAADENAINDYRVRELDKDGNIVYDKDDDNLPDNAKKETAVLSVKDSDGKDTNAVFTVTYDTADYTGNTVISNKLKETVINIEKEWDIDIENNDKPESIETIVQEKTADGKWKMVRLVELNEDNDWKAEISVPESRVKDGKTEEIEYRIRELREETALGELMNGLKDIINTQGKGRYEEWIAQIKTKGKTYWDALPDDIKNASGNYDSLIDKLGAEPESLFDKLTEKMNFFSAESRVVYDSGDSDKPDSDSTDKNNEPNRVSFHVGEHSSVVSDGTEDAHITRYQVSYEKKDGNKYKITNQAILEIDAVKRWLGIGVEEEDMPDSAWVTLMFSPKEGAKDNAGDIAQAAGKDISGVLDVEFPVIDPIDGGRDPISIISEIAVGVDVDIFSDVDAIPKLAIAKVDKDCGWTKHFVVSKYYHGIPMEFKGAELSSEIVRQIVKYLLETDLFISYNPFDNYFSIPTKAIRTFEGMTDPGDMLDISKLTGAAKTKAQSLTMEDIKNFGPASLLSDWQLMANVINVKIDIDLDRDDDDEPKTISGKKIWDSDEESKRPDTLKIHVRDENDREIEGSPIELKKTGFSGKNEWTWELPIPENAEEDAEYFVSEEYPAGYEYEDNYILETNGYILTNSWREDAKGRRTVSGQKTWKDKKDQDGIRPEKITVHLLADGRQVAQANTSQAGLWRWVFPDLPVYNGGGQKIDYTITEDLVEGYETTIDGFNITNSHTPVTIGIKGEKTWDDNENQDGGRPACIIIRLKADGTEVDRKTVTAAKRWKWSFERLPKTAGGREIIYTISEDVVPDYISQIDEYDVTNSYLPGKTQINVNKVWDDGGDADGIRPDSVTVQLFADGADTGKTVTLSEANKWTDSFTRLEAKKDGKAIVYTAVEKTGGVITGTDGEGTYSNEVSGDAVTGFTITNKHTPKKTKVEGVKTWADNNDRDGKRPGSITVRLKADGAEVDHKTVTVADGWKWSFKGLPEQSGGRNIVYTVSEDTVADYTSEVSGYNVKNTYTPGKTQINVNKVWDDSNNKDNIRPSSVTITLLADGADTGKTVTLSEANKWTESFTALEAVKDGKTITYTVSEKTDTVITGTDGEGTYSFAVTGDAVKGYTVTNKHTPKTDALTYTITYKLNGGSYGGSSADIIERYSSGTVITVHAAPVRDGYKFLYWKGSEYQPGDKYTVAGDHTFTAQWEKNDTPSGNPPGSDTPSSNTPGSNTPSSNTPGSSPSQPSTGDSGSFGLWFALFACSLAVLAGMLILKRYANKRRGNARGRM